jgi:hypothetical protein
MSNDIVFHIDPSFTNWDAWNIPVDLCTRGSPEVVDPIEAPDSASKMVLSFESALDSVQRAGSFELTVNNKPRHRLRCKISLIFSELDGRQHEQS